MKNWSWLALCALLVNCHRGSQPKLTTIDDANTFAPTLLSTHDLPGAIPNPATVNRAALTGSTCKVFPNPSETNNRIKLTRVFAGLAPTSLVSIQQPDNDKTRWFMLEQSGRVSVFPNRDNVTDANRTTALDLSSLVETAPQAGARGFLLHHNYINNGVAYVAYAGKTSNPGVVMTLERYNATSDSNVLSPSGTVLLTQPVRTLTDLAGTLQQSADGLLYWSLGAGDGAASPGTDAQDPCSLRGKLLRIDADNANGTIPYSIPDTNPYAVSGGAPEIFALGVHNLWRFSVDKSGVVIGTDIHQGNGDEIDIQVAAGDNLGWPIYQGNALVGTPAPGTDYVRPGFWADPNFCFTGGMVYHGQSVANALSQTYVFGDCQSGNVWAVVGSTSGNIAVPIAKAPAGVVNFAEDNDGELYVLTQDGGIYRIDPVPADSFLPRMLSQTGCTSPNDIMAVPSNTLNYRVRLPFWSDGADKGRTLALPADGTMQVDGSDHLVLPPGTVVVKNFEKLGKRLETRLFMRYMDGTWGGYSYAWNDAQTDAVLVASGGATLDLADGSQWYYPARGACDVCHSAAPGYSLGWQVLQLNTDVTFSDGSHGNQLDAFVQEGVLAPMAVPTAQLPQLPDPTASNVSLESQARSYLHVNCSICHQPGGFGLGPADFRYEKATKDIGVCNATPTMGNFGLANEHLLTPGSAASSTMSFRMHATNGARMPAISSWVVDPAGTAAVDAWINSLKGCP